jgi:hypothetical protein
VDGLLPVPAFCRHNRFLANCPICSREQAAAAPARPARTRSAGAPASRSGATSRRSTGLRTRKLAREAEDGYHSELVPGVKATADAERLARSLADAAARLEYPGPYEALATEPDLEEATWLAFLLALTGPDAPELQAAVLAAHPAWASGEEPGLDPARTRAVGAYRAWAGRAGSQAAAITGEAAWSPQRRFGRIFDRLALPGFGRAARFELLSALGAAGLYPLEAASLHLGGDDPTTVAAKRALVSGDVLLLERRAAALAEAAGIPVAALDRGLARWNAPGRAPAGDGPEPPALGRVRAALGL